MNGCTNPSAKNYDPLATVDDGSCIYLHKVGENCLHFAELPGVWNESFTVSFNPLVDNWVFFHGYIPDYYVHARDQLYTVKNNKLYKHNAGPHGVYYAPTPAPFFIDIVVTENKESLLSALHWVSETLDPSGKAKEHQTFTHVTIWNNYQCTGRIPISGTFTDLQYSTSRKTRGAWNFNELRDIVKNNEDSFLQNIFADYAVDPAKVDVNLPWYEKQLLQDDYFIVRLEYDNTVDNTVVLHQLGASLDNPY